MLDRNCGERHPIKATMLFLKFKSSVEGSVTEKSTHPTHCYAVHVTETCKHIMDVGGIRVMWYSGVYLITQDMRHVQFCVSRL